MTVVIVLGPHRSGTSIVAGILHTIGVDMGSRFREPDEFNPSGYWEDLDFKELNHKILKTAGGTWWYPPVKDSLDYSFGEHEDEVACLIINRITRKNLWGWKDPRQCLLMQYYKPYLTGNVKYIVVMRELDKVAESIMRRERDKVRRETIDKEYWKRLTVKYLESALEATRYKDSLILSFEQLTNDRESARTVITRLNSFIGLEGDKVRRAIDMVNVRG